MEQGDFYGCMAEPIIPGEYPYLMSQIDQLHYTYLHAPESPLKLDEKKRLECLIREYLMVATHNKKFIYFETAKVLHRSAQLKADFSGVKASCGFHSIAAYAHNLLAQSWRKEFREIQTHNGYYQHNVESGLIDADILLCIMGYKKVREGVFVMDEFVDPDRVANVSRDSLFASVECQIICTLYADLLRSGCQYTWLQILEYRETHVGTVDQALRDLICQYNARYFNSCQPECYPKCGVADRNVYNPHSYRMKNNIHMPYYNAADTPDGLYPYAITTCSPTCSLCLKEYNPACPQPVICSVPTGQLIELDAPSSKETSDIDNRKKTVPDAHNSGLVTGQSQASSQSKNKSSKEYDFEAWAASMYTDSKKKLDPLTEMKNYENIAESFRSLTLDDPQDYNERPDPASDKGDLKKSRNDSNGVSPGSSHTLGREKPKKTDSNYFSLKVRLANKRWQCQFCTFCNEHDVDVCVMCCRSKNSRNEVLPLESGGRECPKCTLVNEKGVTKCEVCEEDLKDSPTYI